MKEITTHGILDLQPLSGSPWYWGTDYASGDLYEAEELYRDGHPVGRNRLVFVRFPGGETAEPVQAQDGQYFAAPLWIDGGAALLLADFPKGVLRILRTDEKLETVSVEAELPLGIAPDCYNLALKGEPLMLTRQGQDGKLQILWPERREIALEPTEVFLFQAEGQLVCSAWYEDPEYREVCICRSPETGAEISRKEGAVLPMPDGQWWLVR